MKKEFYSPNGWAGKKYNPELKTKEIAKIVKTYIKKEFPELKTSFSTKRNVSFDMIFISIENHVFLENEIKEIVKKIKKEINEYRYDDSDPMRDYFDTNFYYDIKVL